MPTLGVGARQRDAGVIGRQVHHASLGVVEPVVPGEHVGVGHDGPLPALIRPRARYLGQRDLDLVAVLAVRVSDLIAVGEDVPVEPQAIGRVVQVEGGHRRGVNDREGEGRVLTLAGVAHILDDGSGRVDAELV